MRINKKINVWRFLLEWMLATALGAIASVAIIVITYSMIPVEDSFKASFFTPLWLTIIVTSVSAIQWRVLRSYIPRSAGWIVASFIGAYLVGCAQYATSDYLSLLEVPPSHIAEILIRLALLGVHGAMFGVIQWVVLMPYLRKAWLWVAVNGLSFIVGVESFNSWYFGYLLIWWCIFHAIVQATTLGWLFRKARTGN